MSDREPSAAIPETHHATEYLANERTFLAWIRTSVALISLGFAVAKFDIWFREIGGKAAADDNSTGWSVPIGLAMIAVGGLLPILAACHYRATNRQIAEGRVTPNRGLVGLLTLVVFALALAFLGYFAIRHWALG